MGYLVRYNFSLTIFWSSKNVKLSVSIVLAKHINLRFIFPRLLAEEIFCNRSFSQIKIEFLFGNCD